MTRVTKAVFPVAGLGTRFLPVTKASPKEMLPIVDKPLIQYATEEALAAGITNLIFITGRHKRTIEDHFDKAYELEAELETRNKTELLETVSNILPRDAACVYIRQPETLGLGHAVLQAKAVVGNEPFAIILPDDLMNAEPGVMKQMTDLFNEHQCSIIAVETVPREDTGSYGIVQVEPSQSKMHKIERIVEKPNPDQAPSNLAVIGRYVLMPRIFSTLEQIGTGAGGEYQLTDGIAALMEQEPVFAYEFVGKRYDCGSKFGYLQATIEYALQHPELKDRFREYIKDLAIR